MKRLDNLGRVGVIVASRMSSTRLPGKALKHLHDIPMLSFLFRRLRDSKYTDEIILATSLEESDEVLVDLANNEGISVYCGSLNDVTERYVNAASEFNIDTVVRVTADCPFVNGEIVDYCLKISSEETFDICTTKGQFPVGLDVEIYRSQLIEKLHLESSLTDEHREHLTLYLYHNPDHYRIVEIHPCEKWKGKGRVYTVDTKGDYFDAVSIANSFKTPFFSISELVALEFNED